jgi:ParB family chromosome partitioning protein
MTTTPDISREMAHGELLRIPLAQIVPSPLNPRKRFDPEALEELAASIREHGLLEPIVVRPDDSWFVLEGNSRAFKPSWWYCYSERYVDKGRPVGDQYLPGAPSFRYGSREEAEANLPRYQIIAGERRYRAAQLAGLEEIPATVRECDDREHLELALVENLVRRDIDAIEEAAGYRQLMSMGYRQAEIAEKVNRSQPAVANAIRLLELPEDVQGLISTGALSVSHGKALARWKDMPAVASVLAADAAERGLSSKALEAGSWGYDQQRALFASGAAVDLSGFHNGTQYVQSEFEWRRVCEDCSDKYGHCLCLRPACWHEKRQAVLDERERQAQAAVERATATGKTLPKTGELTHGTYEILHATLPAGCVGAECKHYGQALNGRAVVQICTKPACLRKLLAAVAQAEKAAKKETSEQRLSGARQVLAAASLANDDAFRRMLVVRILGAAPTSQPARIKTVSERLGIPLDHTKFADCYHVSKHAEYFCELARTLSLVQLLRVLGEMTIESNQRQLESWAGAKTEEADFIAGTLVAAEDQVDAVDAVDLVDEDEDGNCVGYCDTCNRWDDCTVNIRQPRDAEA